jgi:hypothetical protein
MTKSSLVAGFLACSMLFSVTACGSGSGIDDVSGVSIEALEQAIIDEFPNCAFENLEVKTDHLYTFDDPKINQAWLTYRQNTIDYVFEKDSEGNNRFDVPHQGVTFLGASDSEEYRICNTKGRILSSITDKNPARGLSLEEETGLTFCWIPGRAPTSKEQEMFKECEARIETKSKLGFWFVIHEYPSAEEATAAIAPMLEEDWTYGYSSYPMMLVGNKVVSVDGAFDDVNQATVDELDLAWGRISEKLSAISSSSLVDGYPDTFDRSKWSEHTFNTADGTRVDLDNAYEKLSRYLTCNTSLKISEFDFTPGECGKTEIEVFQSDLSTGECNALGYWTDLNGNEKIGVFEYCGAYNPGSLSENSTYSLKVRVSGTTSYMTKLGYQNEVLSFSVVG